MVDADFHVLSSLFLFLDKAGCETSASSVDHGSALLPPDRRMQAQVLSAGQAKASKLFFSSELLGSIFHKCRKLCQSLLNLGHCP